MKMQLLFALLLVALTGGSARGDAILDAKRKAAHDLMREGKAVEAVALIQEVIGVEPGNYRDHLLLGRAYDKLNKSSDAVRAYRATLAKLPPTAGGPDERMARAEAERRLKILDQMTGKVRLVEEDFLKKLDVLEKEAASARDQAALVRVLKLKAGVYAASDHPDCGGFEVRAVVNHQESPFLLEAGRTYRLRAAGNFTIQGLDCTPDGLKKMSSDNVAPIGALVCFVREDPRGYVGVGSGVSFTPKQSGKLNLFLHASDVERKGASGTVYVLVERD